MQLDQWFTRQKTQAELKIELTGSIGMLILDTNTSKYVQAQWSIIGESFVCGVHNQY